MPYDKFIILLLICLSSAGCDGQRGRSGNSTSGPTPTATVTKLDVTEIIKRMATQDGCKDFSAEMRMVSTSENGGRNQIEFKIQRKYSGDRASTFITVLSPREETDKALLAIERRDQPTTAFFYLPGLKKLTRLSSGKQLVFRDANVTIQELLGMELSQYTHSSGERTGDGGQTRIKVEFKEKPDLGLAYPRIVGFFRVEDRDHQPERFELYNSRGELLKVVTVEEVRRIENYQTMTRLEIEDIKRKQRLNLETRKVDYDSGLPDNIFTENHLKRFVNFASHIEGQTR